jgi:hypothetical protein
MPAIVLPAEHIEPHRTPRESPGVLKPLQELSAAVRRFQPDVVILVARKMPHLAERLSLDFGDGCLVMSDLAIRFAHDVLRGARVAIIDDVVNVGSTLLRARNAVVNCGAAAVETFSIGYVAGRQLEIENVHYVASKPLSEFEYQHHVRSVPRVISELSKPYDLSFPILPCRMRLPVANGDGLFSWLVMKCGADAVHELTPVDARDGLHRFTVDLQGHHGNYKVRFYVDDDNGVCNVVPIAIPPDLETDPLPFQTAGVRALFACLSTAVADAPSDAELWPGEDRARAALFALSLDCGLQCLNDWTDALVLESCDGFSVEAAVTIFGPCVHTHSQNVPFSFESIEQFAPIAGRTASVAPTSPFLEKFPVTELIANVKHGLQDSTEIVDGNGNPRSSDLDVLRAFELLFEHISRKVGANCPIEYALDWPFSRSEIQQNSYLRLRIGPTFDDLVELLTRIIGPTAVSELPLHHRVSAILDRAIDSGAVVPTIGRYENRLYRIYRRGESPFIDQTIDRIRYALKNHGKPLSLTRIAKVDAILSFSREFAGTTVARPLVRGNTGTIIATVLDDANIEAAGFAMRTGRLVRFTE